MLLAWVRTQGLGTWYTWMLAGSFGIGLFFLSLSCECGLEAENTTCFLVVSGLGSVVNLTKEFEKYQYI